MSKNQTLRQVEAELRRRRSEDPLALVYKPHQFQELIHKSTAPITVCTGANRSGKSYSAVAEALFWCLGRSSYAVLPEPPNTVWYVLPTTGQHTRNIEPILNQLVPVDQIASENKRDRIMKFKNGSSLYFMSADQRQRRLAGASVDLVIIDEPIPYNIFQELQARTIDTNGRILIVMTPVDDQPDRWIWVRDKLFIPWQVGERKDINFISMPIADAQGKSLVPHLSDKQIKDFERKYPDPQDRAVRMYGQFVTRAGSVFKSFDRKVHVIKRFDIPQGWTRWISVDPQYHRFAALFMAADSKGNYYVTDEYFSQDEPMAYRAERIKAILGHTQKSVPCYVDSANPQDIAELNYWFNKVGAKIGATKLPMAKRTDQLILRVQSMLEPQTERVYSPYSDRKGIKGAPRLILFDDLISTWYDGDQKIQTSRLIWEIQRLTWASTSGLESKPDKNSAGGGDMIDALLYGCSIMASGIPQQERADPYRGMPAVDAEIWREMDRMDKRDRLGIAWRFAD